MTRSLRAAALVLGLALTAPAAADAATATITNDSGQPTPLGAPTTIRNMSPVFELAFAESERRYALTINGPDGAATVSRACTSVAQYDPERVPYRGNGRYTAIVTTTTSSTDAACAEGQTSTFQFDINASAKIAKAGGKLITRRPGTTQPLTHGLAVAHNPGSEFTEVRYARNQKPGADGGFAGDTAGGLVPIDQAKAPLTFNQAGLWRVIVRPVVGDRVGPWSSPRKIRVLAPFDFIGSPRFADASGPVYKIRAQVREKGANGRKVKVSLARGHKGGKFHKLKTVRINKKNGRFSVKFRIDDPGKYRIRYAFKGSKTVFKGRVTQKVRITRVLIA